MKGINFMKTKCKIRVGFFVALMAVSVYISSPDYFPALICSVAIHEAGHIIAARAVGIRLTGLRLGIFGAALSVDDTLFSYKKEAILVAGGPAFNFLSVLLLKPLPIAAELNIFFSSSLALGFLNLLPVYGFDGGRIAAAVLSVFFLPRTTEKILKLLSFIIIFSLWCISVYLLMRVGASLSLFVFSSSLFCKIFVSELT